MIIPEQLWIPSAKDAVSQFAPLRRMTFSTVNQALGSVTEDLSFPRDYVFFLQQIQIRGATAGVTTVTVLAVSVVDSVFNTVGRIRRWDFVSEGIAAPTSFERGANGDPLIILMPNDILRFDWVFSAAAAGNIVEKAFSGILIPRGNWQLG